MKVLFVLDAVDAWKHGIWFHRQQIPAESLGHRGHAVRQVAMGAYFPDEMLNWPDVVVFGRTYATVHEPIKWMREFKKLGKRIVYDMDDDFWQVEETNPSVKVSNALKDQYEGMIRESDAIITPSGVLAKKFKKLIKGKPIFICPNGINHLYQERPHQGPLSIGYMGAASHWKDLQLIGNVVNELSKKYDFVFKIYGLVGEPLEASIYAYTRILNENLQPEKNKNSYMRAAVDFMNQLKDSKVLHIPFMPPELHPRTLAFCDFDIGLCPLEDTEFNAGKSCIKYYEYAGVGTVTIASDVLPYKEEVNYRAKNTFKDWYNKLEKLLVDKDFREKILAQQRKYVNEKRTVEQIGLDWELALQNPGGLPVKNQQR